MKKKWISLLLAAIMTVTAMGSLFACGKKKVGNTITNPGFETGNLSGWTKDGNAFQLSGVVESDVVGGVTIGKNGSYYFNGLEAGPQSFTGTLKSGNFKIEGKGRIAFLMGAAENRDKIFVSVHNADNDSLIVQQTENYFDGTFVTVHMIRYILDVSAHIGKTVYIKITDNDNADVSNYAYALVDDFVTYVATDADLQALEKERDDKLSALQPPEFTEDETSNYIQNPGFETTPTTQWIPGWKILSGTALDANALAASTEKFWETREFYAAGNYLLNGFNNAEGAVGAIRSSKFTLGGDGYISFLIGGAKTDDIYVALVDAETDTELVIYKNTATFSDPAMTLNLHREYWDASEYLGDVLYIKIVDNDSRSGDFAAGTFDDFHVSMTEQETKDLMVTTFNFAKALPSTDSAAKTMLSFYENYAYPVSFPALKLNNKVKGQAVYVTEGIDLTAYLDGVTGSYEDINGIEADIEDVVTPGGSVVSTGFESFDLNETGVYIVNYFVEYTDSNDIIHKTTASFNIDVVEDDKYILNGGFESGNLAGWTVLSAANRLKADNAVSSDSVFWGEEIPYNNGGQYHFNGWSAQYDEAHAYSLRSSVFTLGGSGYISFKMGGNAAQVRVFMETGLQIATYNNTEFADVSGTTQLSDGSRLATMTTFVANLSGFVGEKLYIELHDTGSGTWAVAFFDDIVTYYEEAPDVSTKSDTVTVLKNKVYSDFVLPWKTAENKFEPSIEITKKAEGGVMYATDAGVSSVDLTEYISDTEAYFANTTKLTTGVEIISVKKLGDTEATTTGFNAFDLSQPGIYTVTYRFSYAYNGNTYEKKTYTTDATFNIDVAANSNYILNGGFESGNLSGWTVVSGNVDESGAISGDSIFWGEKIPYNNGGQYHFNGWGACEAEKEGYVLRSTTFTLGGSGHISFKMGGNAAQIWVYKADGTLLKKYYNSEFADPEGSFPHLDLGSRLATMTTFVADLNEHLGEELYIELHDIAGEYGWAAAFFDDIVTYYETAPVVAERSDTVTGPVKSGNKTVYREFQLPWKAATEVVVAGA